MVLKPSSAKQRKDEARSDPAVSYNDFKEWSATQKAQRKRMIMFLQNVIADLEKQNDSERDGVVARAKPSAERHDLRATRRSMVKRDTSMRRRARRASPRRRSQRAARP